MIKAEAKHSVAQLKGWEVSLFRKEISLFQSKRSNILDMHLEPVHNAVSIHM
jgi:hypothetical protein